MRFKVGDVVRMSSHLKNTEGWKEDDYISFDTDGIIQDVGRRDIHVKWDDGKVFKYAYERELKLVRRPSANS